MKRFYQIWWIALTVKLLIAAFLPLLADECYYWVWSHDLQLSYYDHPPMVAVLFWLGHPFENWGHASRWPAVILVHASLLVWRHILKPLLTEEQLNWWILAMVLHPMTGAGSIIITPDSPLLIFWPLCLLLFLKALKDAKPLSYLALGASLGLGFCSKYNLVLIVPIFLIWLQWSKQWQKVKWQFLPLTVVAGLVFCSPVLIWNYQNNFDSFLYQIRHGLGQSHFNPKWTFGYIGDQLLLIFPVFAFLAFRRLPKKREAQWIMVCSLLPLGVFFLSSFKGRVEANWPLVAYPAILGLAIFNGIPAYQKWISRTHALFAVALALIITELIFAWLPVPPEKLKTYEFKTYDPLLSLSQTYTPFYANSFQMASYLSYKLKKPVYKMNGMGRRDYFDYKKEGIPSAPKIYMAFRHFDEFPDQLKRNYKQVKRLAQLNDDLFLYEFDRKIEASP